MKKTVFVSIMSFIFLTSSSLVAYLLRYSALDNWQCFGIATLILVFSAFVCLIFKDFRGGLITSLLLNASALGFLIRAWYIFRNFDNSLWIMVLIALVCVIYIWLFYLLLSIPFIEKHVGWFLLAFVILSLIAYVFLVAFTTTTFLSTLGFYMIVQIAFIIGLCLDAKNNKEIVKHLLYCSFSVVIVAIIIALAMLSGDGSGISLDGIGGGEAGSLKSPRKKNKDLPKMDL